MKIKIFLAYLLFWVGLTLAQDYPLVTIQDIQIPPDTLIGVTDPPSVLNGDTIRVQGLVLARPVIDADTARRVIISAGARWVTYIQDPNGGLWGGLNVLQDDTLLAHQGTFFDLVDTAQVVEFTGVVTEFNTTTEILLVLNPQPVPVQIVRQQTSRPAPIELSLSDLFTVAGTYNFDAEKYEGMFVIFRNIITSDRASNGNFKINDGLGHSAFIYNQSRYFKTGTAGEIPGYQPPLDGSYLSYLRGIVTTRTGGYYIVPVYPGDVGPAITSPPIISSIRRSPVEVNFNQDVTVTAKITDIDGTVASAKLFYRVNGGARDSVVMSSPDTIYSAVIPGLPDSSLVDFYITSTDNEGNLAIFPSDTTRSNYFYLVLNRPITIKDVQYSPFGSGFSAFNNYRIIVSGVVTADTANSYNRAGNATNRVIMQDGEGAWSGIWLNALNVAAGLNVFNLNLGENITVSGLIAEDFDVTRIDSITAITFNSTGNPIPEAQILQTGTIGTKAGGTVEAEQWESVFVGFENVSVPDANADGPPSNFGELFINDGSGNTRVELQDGNHFYHNVWDSTLFSNSNFIEIKQDGHLDKLTGIMYYSFSNYKLVPRYNSDFVGYTIVGVNDNQNEMPVNYSLSQNYPNPFNPSTTISYAIPNSGNVVLKIYNVLGQQLKTLINQFQSAGTHKVSFDASSLSSGVYFYSIQVYPANSGVDNFTKVKKMVLLK